MCFFLATRWGYEHLAPEGFIEKMIAAGYNGIDTWLPQESGERKAFTALLSRLNIPVVCQQYQATGSNIKEFCRSYEYYLHQCLEADPVLINSHSGRDYFSVDDQLRVIDTAAEFSARHNIMIAHETHRGRLGFSPYNAAELFASRPQIQITADLSHWVCVTESYLEHCPDILSQAIQRTAHIHARVGHTQGSQVSDPRASEWQHALNTFVNWWQQMADHSRTKNRDVLTITPEFGPPPYMTIDPRTGETLADQFSVNCYLKDMLVAIL